ncbi:MAG: TlpA disulfide reductase family protein [Bacteroidota bacterium]
MNRLYLFIILLVALPLAGQQTEITVEATNCRTLNLYAFNGSGFDLVQPFSKGADGNWTTTVNLATPSFRYVGSKPSDALPIIVGDKAPLTITGTCGRLRNGKVQGSPINVRYQALKATFRQHSSRFATSMRAYNQAQAKKDSVTMKQERAALVTLDNDKRQLLEEVKADYPLLAKVISLNTYLIFINENQGRFPNELDYFVNTYFQFVDFQDESYNDLPWTYEGHRNFTNTLAGAISGEQLGDILLAVFDQWPAGSRAQFFAMSGGFAALSQKKHPATIKLADAIEQRFKEAYPKAVAHVRQQAAGLRTYTIGAEAPDFTGLDPEGQEISLSDLRGKVVLIDFWASWCGPCRKENPNVVKMYAKYKDQGFEILGVSLDNTKSRWLKAIEDDKLTWLHVSDLKGWRSAFAQQYGVSSIPQTILLDKAGNILARNLRGAGLEQKLAEIFATK